jgi:hypothetical protein
MSNEMTPDEKAARREFHDRVASVGVLRHGRSRSTTTKDSRRSDGVRIKETVDEHGNSTIEHATKDDRVDVMIRPKTVDLDLKLQG